MPKQLQTITKRRKDIYYKEVILPQFLQNYKETKTKFQALNNIVQTKTGTKIAIT